MPPSTKEIIKRTLPALLLIGTRGCLPWPIKNIRNLEPTEQKVSTSEYLYLRISTPDQLVTAMGISGENVLLSLANSGSLSVDIDSQLTDRQVGLIVENMRSLTSVTSITDLGIYRFYLGNYLTTDANTNNLMAFTAASNTLTKILLLHWEDINWFNDTTYQSGVKGVTNRVDANDKRQVLNDFILKLEEFSTPLDKRKELSNYSLTIIPENAQRSEWSIQISFEEFMNNLESLRQGYDIKIANGVPST